MVGWPIGFRPTQRKVKLKSTTEINNDSRTRLIFFLSKTERPTLRQMPGTTLIQQVLQNSTVNRRSNYVARACLILVTPQNVQLNIQMFQKHRSQWQAYPSRCPKNLGSVGFLNSQSCHPPRYFTPCAYSLQVWIGHSFRLEGMGG